MPLTSQQDIPKKPEARESWTFKRLFPFSGAVQSLSKLFTTPLDMLLGYLVFMLGVAEILDRRVSVFFWILTIAILALTVFERRTGIPSNTKKSKEDKKRSP